MSVSPMSGVRSFSMSSSCSLRGACFMQRPSFCVRDSCRRCIIGIIDGFGTCVVLHAARVVVRSMSWDELSAVFRFRIWSFSSVS